MERNAVKQLNMVSRLPKFTSHTSGTTMTPLPQGSALPVSSLESKGGHIGRHNSSMRVQSLSWRKGEEDSGNKVEQSDSFDKESSVTTDSQSPVMVTKKPSPAAVVKCKSAVPNAQSSCPRSIPQPSKTIPRMNTPKRLSAGNPPCNGIANLQGVSSGNGRDGSSGPGLGHASQQKTLQSKLSMSNNSIKSASKETIVHSQSLTHFKKAACPTNPPMTRSFSFNKATELAKELPRPLSQSLVAKSPLIQPNPVFPEEKVGKNGIPRPSVTTSDHLLPKTTVKKSLLPSFSGKKSSVLSYKLTRPIISKHLRPFVPETVHKEAELSKNIQDPTQIAETSSEPTSSNESIEITPSENSFEGKEVEGILGPSLEVLDNMSLSSSSSVENNDTSEEYMDDFDNLGNGGETLLLPVFNEELDHLRTDDNTLITKCNEESSVTNLHTFLSETLDWAGMGFTAGKDDFVRETSPSGDFPHGSSLDLSPSDSSGGTYMWDEEGMEALGGSVHPCGSFGSDLNSMDILNNLENVESCDLEEDDLMLDLDLSEDTSLHSDTDGMSPYECSENEGWPIRRRRQQHWGRCENRTDILQSFDGFRGQGLERSRPDHVALDELTLKLMVQDCSSVKDQLLQLKILLQMETDGSVEESLEAYTPQSTDQTLLDQKVALLLKEVQELRNELRSKDRMIAELSQQLSSPVEDMQCHCLQGSEANKESAEHQDKDTQTLWRPHNLQILQTHRFLPNKLHNHEGLSSPTSTNAPCDSLDAKLSRDPLMPKPCSPDLQSPIAVESTANCTLPTVTISTDSTAASSSRTFQSFDPAKLSLVSSHHKINEPASPTASASFYCKLEKDIQKLPLTRNSFSTLQPPTYTKRSSTLIKPQDGQQVSLLTRPLGRLGATGQSRTRHELLPASGLARQTTVDTTIVAPICNKQNKGYRQSQFLRKNESSLPRANAPLQPKHSQLPKRKAISSLPNP